MCISVHIESAAEMYTASKHATQSIVGAIKHITTFQIRFLLRKTIKGFLVFCDSHQRALQRAMENDLAVWLSITSADFDLSAQELCDALPLGTRIRCLICPLIVMAVVPLQS